MDTRSGQIVFLDDEEALTAKEKWIAWEAGLIKEMPRYAPVQNDKTPVKAKARKRKRTRVIRSYKEFCR
jgi:hypothetical protein